MLYFSINNLYSLIPLFGPLSNLGGFYKLFMIIYLSEQIVNVFHLKEPTLLALPH